MSVTDCERPGQSVTMLIIQCIPRARTHLHRSDWSNLATRWSRQSRLQSVPLRSITQTGRPLQQQRSADVLRNKTSSKIESPESVKPEDVLKSTSAKPQGVPKTDGLLSEQTVSNKEQRKADWAIMKEMARYLWPKVCSLYEAQGGC